MRKSVKKKRTRAVVELISLRAVRRGESGSRKTKFEVQTLGLFNSILDQFAGKYCDGGFRNAVEVMDNFLPVENMQIEATKKKAIDFSLI